MKITWTVERRRYVAKGDILYYPKFIVFTTNFSIKLVSANIHSCWTLTWLVGLKPKQWVEPFSEFLTSQAASPIILAPLVQETNDTAYWYANLLNMSQGTRLMYRIIGNLMLTFNLVWTVRDIMNLQVCFDTRNVREAIWSWKVCTAESLITHACPWRSLILWFRLFHDPTFSNGSECWSCFEFSTATKHSMKKSFEFVCRIWNWFDNV